MSLFSWFSKSNEYTIFHITHQKAGSQWIKAVFKSIDPDRVVESRLEVKQFFEDPIREGKIYPALYCTREQFESVKVPGNHLKFIVIRDLRDTLVSLYFSMKYSHEVVNDFIQNTRDQLEKIDVPEGLIFLIENNYIEPLARIQESWLDFGVKIIKYEKLIANDLKRFRKIFKYCKLSYPKKQLLNAVRINSFETKTRGRKIGQEDPGAHLRKGIPGDWRNYFTGKITGIFKKRYGDLLIKTGYEKDLHW